MFESTMRTDAMPGVVDLVVGESFTDGMSPQVPIVISTLKSDMGEVFSFSVAQKTFTYIGCLKNFANQLSTQALAEHARWLPSWKAEVLALSEDGDQFSQHRTMYTYLHRFQTAAARTIGAGIPPLADLKSTQLHKFMDMCFRDYAQAKVKRSSSLARFLGGAAKLPTAQPTSGPASLRHVSVRPGLPLQCLPAHLYGQVDLVQGSMACMLPLVPPARCVDAPGSLNRAFFNSVVKQATCTSKGSSCQGNIAKLSRVVPEVDFIVNPILRDRAVMCLERDMLRGERASGTRVAAIAAQNLFNPKSSFMVMQRFIMELEAQVKRLSGPSATIIGEFEPVTDAGIYPIPLFKRRSDGQLLGFFWHGTSEEAAASIAQGSFLLSRNGETSGGLYGPGMYFAPETCKALAYTGGSGKRNCLLLCAVFLGNGPHFQHSFGPAKDIGAAATIVVPEYTQAKLGLAQHWEIIVRREAQVVPLFRTTYIDPAAPLSVARVPYKPIDECRVM